MVRHTLYLRLTVPIRSGEENLIKEGQAKSPGWARVAVLMT